MDLEKMKYRMGYDNELKDLYESFCMESDLTIESEISYEAFYMFINS